MVKLGISWRLLSYRYNEIRPMMYRRMSARDAIALQAALPMSNNFINLEEMRR
jgi:hypothetical protein